PKTGPTTSPSLPTSTMSLHCKRCWRRRLPRSRHKWTSTGSSLPSRPTSRPSPPHLIELEAGGADPRTDNEDSRRRPRGGGGGNRSREIPARNGTQLACDGGKRRTRTVFSRVQTAGHRLQHTA